MNPWGFMVILFGAVLAWVGIRGTQGVLFADVTGHKYVPGPGSPGYSATYGDSAGPGLPYPLGPGPGTTAPPKNQPPSTHTDPIIA